MTFDTIVETAAGKLRGQNVNGIHVFRGIPYGADTSGTRRFMAPEKPLPWSGVRDALQFGPVAPQPVMTDPNEYVRAVRWNELPGVQGEDCLVLNVWSPGIANTAKRAVMVSIHGGGFANGTSSNPGFDGDSLARFGDVVVVTMNHRLNCLGYLHLGDVHPQFADSGVVGMLDLVMALQWVHDTIGSFGGDPGNVTIMGQSGGAAKVCTLMAMPAATGLFHRAVVQSGVARRLPTREVATRAAEQVLASLGVGKRNIRSLQDMPFERLGCLNGEWGPCVDGGVIPRHPFDPDAPRASAKVPMMIGTNLHDGAFVLPDPKMDEAALMAALKRLFPYAPDTINASYRAADPHASSFQLLARIVTDQTMRRSAMQVAERKAALGQAPAFMYVITFPSSLSGGKWGSAHGLEVPLTFHNVNAWPITGNGADAMAAADVICGAWVAFAKDGKPSVAGRPSWPAYDTATRATMLLDLKSDVENDPYGELIALFKGEPEDFPRF